MKEIDSIQGLVFKIQRHCLHDGPGIRTLLFLKGCPLQCAWCFNPESQSTRPEVMHFPDKCLGCLECRSVCPRPGAIVVTEQGVTIDRTVCDGCGLCAEACPGGAMSLFGRPMTVAEALEVVLRDRVFYDRSGGGLTLSGGETAGQPDFAAAILERCREEGISTAVETSGLASWPDLRRLVDQADLILYDLKLIDPAEHRRWTGADNDLILANAEKVAASARKMIIRVPLITGVNDSPANLSATAEFVTRRLSNVTEIHLLPYELFGEAKYDRLDRPYRLAGLERPDEETVQACRDLVAGYGLTVRVGG